MGLESKESFSLPPVTQTHEIGADIFALAEFGNGSLIPDGREEKRTKQLTAKPLVTVANGLKLIRSPPTLRQDLKEYKEQFHRFLFSAHNF